MVDLLSVFSKISVFNCWRRRQPNQEGHGANRRRDLGVEDHQLERSFEPKKRIFSFEELREATRNFHPDNKLGEGGFGAVYKGTLAGGNDIAVKKLSATSRQGKREFMNEVNLVTTVQHRNLVKLLGCCVQGSERMLVYEYLPNKSLDKLLFGSKDGSLLDWHTRREIIMGTARGLTYLHEDSGVRMVHRDIKASNILLDEKFNPKIADFGLARLFNIEETHISTGVAGTLGYLAPEYVMHGKLSEKADVFSFGVVALEVVSGRKHTNLRLQRKNQRLLDLGWRLYEEKRELELADPRLGNSIIPEEVIRVVHIALLCTQAMPELRPAMSKVVMLLAGRSPILEKPTKPAFFNMNTGGGGANKPRAVIKPAASSSPSSSTTGILTNSSMSSFTSSSSPSTTMTAKAMQPTPIKH